MGKIQENCQKISKMSIKKGKMDKKPASQTEISIYRNTLKLLKNRQNGKEYDEND